MDGNDLSKWLHGQRQQEGWPPQTQSVRNPGGDLLSTNPMVPEAPRVQVVNPLGAMYEHFQHPIYDSFERQFRVLPTDSFYDPARSPSNPFIFPIGGFKVPKNQYLMILGYEFSSAKFGITPGDTVRLEPERMSTLWCFDLDIDGTRPRQCQYEIDPVPISITRAAFSLVRGTGGTRTQQAAFFNSAQANSFALVGGPGKAALPFQAQHYGPQAPAFTMLVKPNQTVQGSGIILRALEVPLAYVQFTIQGFMLAPNVVERFQRESQP